MSLLSADLKRRLKQVAKKVGLLGLANRIEYAYGNRITREAMAFYRQFVPEGALCFDIGAHLGLKTKLFRKLGAKVVAVEPMTECCNELRRLFSSDPNVKIVEAACGESSGTGTLHVSTLDPQCSTLLAGQSGSDAEWKEQQSISIVTLDALIEEHGLPAFCKIDSEGYEANILRGCHQRVPMLSFEFHRGDLDALRVCLQLLEGMGYTRFNHSLGSTFRLAHERWVPAEELLGAIEALADATASGDIYVSAS